MKKFKLFSKEKINNHIIYKFFGIKIKIANYAYTFVRKCYFLQKTNIQAAALHQSTFKQYRNKYKGRKLVVMGCGPSVDQYKPISDAIHIGVNRSFFNTSVNLDYLFIQDYLKGTDDMEKANKYRRENCTKFYGILPEERYNEVKHVITKIPAQTISEANAKPYILEDCPCLNWAENLEFEALGDWCGCIFSALQFALYTNPQEIYLVGCDCSNQGHFHPDTSLNITTDLTPQKQSWIKFKKFASQAYPNTKIISVNPAGLKGLFKDIFQGE